MNHLIISFSIMGVALVRLAHTTFRHTQGRIPTLLFCPLKNYAVRSYLGVEPVVFQERVGHFPPTRGLFQSRIPCGHGPSQAIRENLAKQRVIIPIGSHLPTKHVQVCTRVFCAIILDELWCFELERHNDLKEVGQTI